jgi:hypothetical protein
MISPFVDLSRVAVASLLVLSTPCCRPQGPPPFCTIESLRGTWDMHMEDSDSVEVLAGKVIFGDSTAWVALIATSREGTREPLDYPIQSVGATGMRLRFQFAPIGYVLDGDCFSRDSIRGEYSVQLTPNADSIRGVWSMTRHVR